MTPLFAFVFLAGLQNPLASDAPARVAAPRQASAQSVLLVSGYGSDGIHVYDLDTGAFVKKIEPVPGAQSIHAGPDGLLYACAEKIDEIVRIDPLTLTLVDSFVFDDPNTPGDETGGLAGPTGAVFGPNGNLFVASFNSDSVLEYDGATGAFLGVFVTPNLGGLNGPDAGITFGPDGHLYVPSFWNHQVLRYNGGNGASLGAFVPLGGGGLRQPRDLKFRGDTLFVASSFNNRILAYGGGASFAAPFITTGRPYGLDFRADTGDVYVVGLLQNDVRVFDGTTGALLKILVSSGDGGLNGATYPYVLLR